MPPDVTEILEAVYKGFCNTVVVERAFQKLQDTKRLQKNAKMRRMKRYYQIHTSGLLGEMGRADVQPQAGNLPGYAPRCIPRTAFEALGVPAQFAG